MEDPKEQENKIFLGWVKNMLAGIIICIILGFTLRSGKGDWLIAVLELQFMLILVTDL